MKLLIAVAATLVFVVTLIGEVILGISFDRAIEGRLKRAADANSIEIAAEELQVAIDNMLARGMTKGYTSIIYRTPDEDVGFWYTNIKTAHAEISNLPPTTTPLERSNMLLKLRETLIDHSSDGDEVTAPSGISLFPNNRMFCATLILSLIFAAWGWHAWNTDNYV